MADKSEFWSNEISNGFKRSIFLHLPALLYMALIFYISSLRSISPPSIGLGIEDKIYHFGEYALLSLFLYVALLSYRHKSIQSSIHIIAVVIACIFAGTDELHQYFVPGRESTVGDLIADCLGAITAQAVIWYYLKLRRQKSID
ncbi:MAG TPA: teicoplanin resistance protein VanZ [candidate division Zixibacteria bacterium]|nr:teicoplanin resistance protein VanZ [candidate division Zixibacteria bacterium]HEQ99076.1 teicoplanin resistance protein VanZ [candidate division Zixibacteria bacterium]